MKKWMVCAAALMGFIYTAWADEGMWLVQKLDGIYPTMRTLGL